MTSSKIRLKVGSMELEYEGDPAFLTGGIEDLLTKMSELLPASAAVETTGSTAQEETKEVPPSSGVQLSTSGFASILGAKSCGELALCGLAKLQIVDGADSATKKQIHDEMKTATGYYKQSMRGGNLSKALDALSKSEKVNPLSGDKFSLRAKESEALEAKIADAG